MGRGWCLLGRPSPIALTKARWVGDGGFSDQTLLIRLWPCRALSVPLFGLYLEVPSRDARPPPWPVIDTSPGLDAVPFSFITLPGPPPWWLMLSEPFDISIELPALHLSII